MSQYLTAEPIDVGALLAAVKDPSRGGTVVFVGSVRRGADDGPVTAIAYSAYAEMVAAECDRLLAEARTRWPGVVVALRHRVGNVEAGAPSVAVAAAAPHRAAAFDACRYVIDQFKLRAPIWKKELFDDGRAAWREADPSVPSNSG